MMLYLASISVIPVRLPSNERPSNGDPSPAASAVIDLVELDSEKLRLKKIVHPYELLLSGLFLGFLCCSFGTTVASFIRRQNLDMAFVALTASFLGVLLNQSSASSLAKGLVHLASYTMAWHSDLGSRAAGSALMSVFFVAIGASCGSIGFVLSSTPMLFAFVLIQISTHFLFMLICGRCLRIPLVHTLTASNANVGEPGTAAGIIDETEGITGTSAV